MHYHALPLLPLLPLLPPQDVSERGVPLIFPHALPPQDVSERGVPLIFPDGGSLSSPAMLDALDPGLLIPQIRRASE